MKPARVSNMEANLLPEVVSLTTKLKESQYWPKNDRSKWFVMLFTACALLEITRVAMSLCVVEMAKELDWDKLETGLILSSMFWGYITTQLPAGFLSDTHGGDIIVLYSLFGCAVSTLAVPLVTTETSLQHLAAPSILMVLISRVCLGFSQGFFYPAMYSLLAKKLPISERSMGSAVISSGGAIGALITGSLGSIIMLSFGWRWVFISFGLANVLWVIIWRQYFLRRSTNDDIYKLTKKFESQEHKHNFVTSRKSRPIIPWGKLIRQRAIWAIVIAHFCNNCMYMNLSSWLPTYFHETYPHAKAWIFNVVPYLCIFIGKIVGGQLADKLIKLGCSVTFVRKLSETIATALPGVVLLLLMYATEFWQALACMSLAFGLTGFESSGSICNIQDLSPTFAGSISGMVFTVTAIPGIIGVYATGYILHATGSWQAVFQITAALCFFGDFVYIIFGTSRRIA